jgi:hypothetical protein
MLAMSGELVITRAASVKTPGGSRGTSPTSAYAGPTSSKYTQPPIQWVPGALSLGVKRSGREADHSPPSSTEVKNAWSYTSTPPIRTYSWRGA